MSLPADNLFLEKSMSKKKRRSKSVDNTGTKVIINRENSSLKKIIKSPSKKSARSKLRKKSSDTEKSYDGYNFDVFFIDAAPPVIEELPLGVDEMKCFVCEQIVNNEVIVCPHCKRPVGVDLDDVVVDDPGFSEEVRRLKLRIGKEEGAREDYVNYLFDVAMKIRHIPAEFGRAVKILEKVVRVDVDHYEARLKVSYRYIMDSKWDKVIPMLVPVIYDSHATIVQQQRAFTNLSCAYNFDSTKENRFEIAKAYATEGIALDEVGTFRLWENYAVACEGQGDYEEGLIGYRKSYAIKPMKDTKYNISRLESKIKKIQKKQGKMAPKSSFKIVKKKRSLTRDKIQFDSSDMRRSKTLKEFSTENPFEILDF